MRFVMGFTVISFFLAAAAFAEDGKSNINQQPNVNFVPALPATTQPDNMKVITGSGGKSTSYIISSAPLKDDFVMGDEKAPLVMVEYASMTCPHCAHFANTTLPALEKKYIQTGQMKYVLRQFPLNEAALKAAMLLECVGDQSSAKYYTFARVLFETQNKWLSDNYIAGLETIAMVGGLSREQFGACVNNTDREMRILKQKKLAVDELKLPATPYIFIGGEVYSGDRAVQPISAFIDAKLAQLAKK